MLALNYIKKEDAAYYIKQRSRLLGVMYFAFALVFAFLSFKILPKTVHIFELVNQELPKVYLYAPIITVAVVLMSLVMSVSYFLKQVNSRELQQKLKKYKKGEMIRANQVLDMKDTYFTLAYFGLLFLLFLLGVIVPLYEVTSRY